MWRLRVFVYILVALSVCSVVAYAADQDGQPLDNRPVVVWFFPHPDDETLGMAGAIIKSILAGNKNVFVFLTRGGSTLARLTVGPLGETRELSVNEIKQARMHEATEALLSLGATADDIIFLDYPDGRLSLKQAVSVIALMRKAFPGAALRTVSVYDPHPDHKVLATAVASVAAESDIPIDIAYYRVYIYRQPEGRRNGTEVVAEKVPDVRLKQAAINAYHIYDPANGYYAVGGRSVPDLMTAAADDQYEYRDAYPVNLHGTRTTYVTLENRAVVVGTEFADSVADWRLALNGEMSTVLGISVRLYYKLANLPALGQLYFGGAWRVGQSNSHAYTLVGISALSTFYVEYLLPLGEPGYAAGVHWGMRWILP